MRLFPLIVPDVAVKSAEAAPAGTLTEAGMVSAAVLLASEKNSSAIAGAARSTVHLAVEAPGIIGTPDTTGRAHVSPERAEIAGLAVILADSETPL